MKGKTKGERNYDTVQASLEGIKSVVLSGWGLDTGYSENTYTMSC